jgi:hypothetical protein
VRVEFHHPPVDDALVGIIGKQLGIDFFSHSSVLGEVLMGDRESEQFLPFGNKGDLSILLYTLNQFILNEPDEMALQARRGVSASLTRPPPSRPHNQGLFSRAEFQGAVQRSSPAALNAGAQIEFDHGCRAAASAYEAVVAENLPPSKPTSRALPTTAQGIDQGIFGWTASAL